MTDPSIDYTNRELAATRQPVELFRFWRPGSTGTTEWCYTSGDATIEHQGRTYAPAPINRGNISQDSGLKVTQIGIAADYLAQPLVSFLVNWPIEIIWVEVRKIFRDDLADDGLVIFLGQISKVAIKGRKAEVTCVGFEYFLKQKLPILRYQVQCNWRLFSEECGIDSSGHQVTASITVSSDGLTVSAAAFAAKPDNYFTWGYLVWGDYRRPVTAHDGADLTMRYPIAGLMNGATVTVYAGCDRTLATCASKYGNRANFGGFPYIPNNNPVTLVQSPTQQRGKK